MTRESEDIFRPNNNQQIYPSQLPKQVSQLNLENQYNYLHKTETGIIGKENHFENSPNNYQRNDNSFKKRPKTSGLDQDHKADFMNDDRKKSGWRRQVVLKNYVSADTHQIQLNTTDKQSRNELYNNLRKSVKRIEWHSKNDIKKQEKFISSVSQSNKVSRCQKRTAKQSRLNMIRSSQQQSDTSQVMQPRMITLLNPRDEDKSGNIDDDEGQDSHENLQYIVQSVNGKQQIQSQFPMNTNHTTTKDEAENTNIILPTQDGYVSGTTAIIISPGTFQPVPFTAKNKKVPLFATQNTQKNVKAIQTTNDQLVDVATFARNGSTSGYLKQAIHTQNEQGNVLGATSPSQAGLVMRELQSNSTSQMLGTLPQVSPKCRDNMLRPFRPSTLKTDNQSLAVMRYSMSNKHKHTQMMSGTHIRHYLGTRRSKNQVGIEPQGQKNMKKERPRTSKHVQSQRNPIDLRNASELYKSGKVENVQSTTNTNTLHNRFLSPTATRDGHDKNIVGLISRNPTLDKPPSGATPPMMMDPSTNFLNELDYNDRRLQAINTTSEGRFRPRTSGNYNSIRFNPSSTQILMHQSREQSSKKDIFQKTSKEASLHILKARCQKFEINRLDRPKLRGVIAPAYRDKPKSFIFGSKEKKLDSPSTIRRLPANDSEVNHDFLKDIQQKGQTLSSLSNERDNNMVYDNISEVPLEVESVNEQLESKHKEIENTQAKRRATTHRNQEKQKMINEQTKTISKESLQNLKQTDIQERESNLLKKGQFMNSNPILSQSNNSSIQNEAFNQLNIELSSLTRLTQADIAKFNKRIWSFNTFDRKIQMKTKKNKVESRQNTIRLLKDENRTLRVVSTHKIETQKSPIPSNQLQMFKGRHTDARSPQSLSPVKSRTFKSGIGLVMKHDPSKALYRQKQVQLENFQKQIEKYRYITLTRDRNTDQRIDDYVRKTKDLKIEALKYTDTKESKLMYQKVVNEIKKDNLELVFINLEIPTRRHPQHFNEQFMKPFEDFAEMHCRCVMMESQFSLANNHFFKFAYVNGLVPFIFERKDHNQKDEQFTNILHQSTAYIAEARTPHPVSGKIDSLTNIYSAQRVLSLGLNQYNFNTVFLNNIAILKAVQGHLIESLLILKKLHRSYPDSSSIKHNLIFVSLLGEWYFDTCSEFDLDRGHSKATIKMMKFCRTEFKKIIIQNKRKIEMKRPSKLVVRSKSNEDICNHDDEELQKIEIAQDLVNQQFSARVTQNLLHSLAHSSYHLEDSVKSQYVLNDRCRVIEFNRQMTKIRQAQNIESKVNKREIDRFEAMKQNLKFDPQDLKQKRLDRTEGELNLQPFKIKKIAGSNAQRGRTRNAQSQEYKKRRNSSLLTPEEEHPDTKAFKEKMKLYKDKMIEKKRENYLKFKELADKHIHCHSINIDEKHSHDHHHHSGKSSSSCCESFKARAEDEELLSLFNQYDEQGNKRTDCSMRLDQIFLDVIRLFRGHLMAQKDRVNEDHGVLVDGIRQLNEMVPIGQFVKLYEESIESRLKNKQIAVGRTKTLEFMTQKKGSPQELLMQQLDKNAVIRKAKCLITNLLLEKTQKEKRAIIRVIEYIAINEAQTQSENKSTMASTQAIKEISEVISTILDGVLAQQLNKETVQNSQMTNYDKYVEIDRIQAQIDIDVFLIKKLSQIQSKMKLMQEAERNLLKFQMLKQFEDLKDTEYLNRLGVSYEENEKRNLCKKFFQEREVAEGKDDGDVNESSSNSDESDQYEKDLEYKIAIDAMAKNERLGQRPSNGQKPEQLFDYKKIEREIMKIVESITVTFEKELSTFFLEELKQMQPHIVKWRQGHLDIQQSQQKS